jgi:hypothetical protein
MGRDKDGASSDLWNAGLFGHFLLRRFAAGQSMAAVPTKIRNNIKTKCSFKGNGRGRPLNISLHMLCF